METITSDQGEIFEIVEYMSEYNPDGTLGYIEGGFHTGLFLLRKQKSSNQSETQESTPTTEIEKKDFGKKLITYMRDEGLFTGNVGSHTKIKIFLSSNGYL